MTINKNRPGLLGIEKKNGKSKPEVLNYKTGTPSQPNACIRSAKMPVDSTLKSISLCELLALSCPELMYSSLPEVTETFTDNEPGKNTNSHIYLIRQMKASVHLDS